MGAYSIVDPTRSERRSNRDRNSNVELWPALQAQTIDRSRGATKLSVCLRRQTVRPSLERGKGNRRIYTRFTLHGGYSNTAVAIRSPNNLSGLLVAACRCSRSSERDCRQRVESRSSGVRSEPGEGQSDFGTTGWVVS